MFGQPFRIQPQGPPEDYKTYQIVTPQTPEHYRPATCEEVECEHWRRGWITRVPVNDADMLKVVMECGRPFEECTADEALPERSFLFEAGTPCFRASTHRIRTDKPDLFIVRGGDWRGNPRGDRRTHQRPEDWVEDFAEHTSAIADQLEKG